MYEVRNLAGLLGMNRGRVGEVNRAVEVGHLATATARWPLWRLCLRMNYFAMASSLKCTTSGTTERSIDWHETNEHAKESERTQRASSIGGGDQRQRARLCSVESAKKRVRFCEKVPFGRTRTSPSFSRDGLLWSRLALCTRRRSSAMGDQ